MAIIYDGNFKGLSDGKFAGVPGSFYRCEGIDGHSQPGTLLVHQKLSKESGSTVDADVIASLAASDGSSLWFSRGSGKIWRRTSAGVWSTAYTTTPAAGAVGCLGAAQYDGRIYWATQSRLHYMPDSDLADSSWAARVVEDFGTFTNTDTEYHTMQIVSQALYIGDGSFVASITDIGDTHVFTAKALDLKKPHKVKALIDYDIDLLIGTTVADNVNKAEIYRWDLESTSWTSSDPIDEVGINAFIRDGNNVLVQAGKFGRMYFYDGVQLVPFTTIPGDYTDSGVPQTMTMEPEASATYLNIPRFGVSNDSNNPISQGVYSLGSYSKDYPKVMDLSFPLSTRDSDDTTITTKTGLNIGSVLSIGSDLLVSWKKGADTSYGVDALDTTLKYENANIETMQLAIGSARDSLKHGYTININHASQITDTDVGFKVSYKKKFEASYDTTSAVIYDTDLFQTRAEVNVDLVANMQFKIDFNTDSNLAPTIETITYEETIGEKNK